MRQLLSLLVVLVCWGCVLGEEPLTPGPDELQALVKQLGSRDFDAREDAQMRLVNLGEAAREVLTQGLKDSDPEISASSAVLLDKIDRAVLAVRVVDSTEHPLPGVPVVFNLDFRDGHRLIPVLRNETINTDADGWASVGNIKPGGGYNLNVSSQRPEYIPVTMSAQRMELKVKRYEFKLVAIRYVTVTGTLLDRANGPLADRRLFLVQSDRLQFLEHPERARIALQGVPVATTDERGQFKFEWMNPGEYAVVLMGTRRVIFKSDIAAVEPGGTCSMGALVTRIYPAVSKSAEDLLWDDGEDGLPQKGPTSRSAK